MATKKKAAKKNDEPKEAAVAETETPTLPAVRHSAPAVRGEERGLTVDELDAQMKMIHEMQRRVMREGVHYGVIPGVDKPSLYQPGAQCLCLAFKLDPEFEQVKERDGDHLNVYSKCTIYSTITGKRLGSADASCSTHESRFSLRKASRSCPECGKAAIFKSKYDNGGWYCWQKKDGCGAKFADNDKRITEQATGMTEVDNIWDSHNAVIKQANIRALRSAVLNVTAASDIFTVDMGPDDRTIDVEGGTVTELSEADKKGVQDFVDSTAVKDQPKQGKPAGKPAQQQSKPQPTQSQGGQQGSFKTYPITEKHKQLRAEILEFVGTYRKHVASELQLTLTGDEKKDLAMLSRATLKQFTAFNDYPGREMIEHLSDKQVGQATHALHETKKNIEQQLKQGKR